MIDYQWRQISQAQLEEEEDLQNDFGSCWSVWFNIRWRASPKDLFYWSREAETAADMREQLDRAMAAAVPELRARLAEAEAAAGRLRERAKIPSAVVPPDASSPVSGRDLHASV